MLDFFKKKLPKNSETVTFKVDGMHCTSCSLNIDGELEDAEGVLSAQTSYAQGITKVVYLPEKVSISELKEIISQLNYRVS